MKKIFRFILILIMSLSVTACSGNFSQVNLDEPIAIPENGIIEKSVFDKIKMLYATDEQFKKKLILFVNEYCKNQK